MSKEEGSFAKGTKVAMGVVFGLFLIGLLTCGMCTGGLTCLGAVGASADKAAKDKYKKEQGIEKSAPDLEFVDASYRVTEKNQVWWKYAYQVEVKNNTPSTESASFTIKFVDADGFEVEKDVVYGESVSAGETKTISGSRMIQLPAAQNITGVEVSE